MFEFCCVFCNEKLIRPGAIIISPPLREEHDLCSLANIPKNASVTHKFHVCVSCYEDKVVCNFV